MATPQHNGEQPEVLEPVENAEALVEPYTQPNQRDALLQLKDEAHDAINRAVSYSDRGRLADAILVLEGSIELLNELEFSQFLQNEIKTSENIANSYKRQLDREHSNRANRRRRSSSGSRERSPQRQRVERRFTCKFSLLFELFLIVDLFCSRFILFLAVFCLSSV